MADATHRYHMTKGGLLFLALTGFVYVGAFNSDINLLVLICATMLSFMAVSFFMPVFVLRGLTVRRALPPDVYADEPFRIALRVRNPRSNRARSVAALDEIRRGKRVLLRPRAWIACVNGQGEAGMSYCAQLPKRGAYLCKGPTLRTGFPFGLAGGSRTVAGDQELLVFPARGRLKKNISVVLHRTRSLVGASARRSMGEEEFRSLREFIPGDNPRRIHWRTTARLGEPYVREMEWARESSLLIMVDTRAAEEDEDRAARLDQALSFSAEVARRVVADGGIVRFAAYAPELVVVDAISEPRELRDMLTAMARLRPAPGRSLSELVGEKRVGFHVAGRRLAVFLDGDSEAGFRQRFRGSFLQAYVVGTHAFNAIFELTLQEPSDAVFRVEAGRSGRGGRP